MYAAETMTPFVNHGRTFLDIAGYNRHMAVPSSLDECARVRAAILAHAASCGFNDHEESAIVVALQEAMTNAVVHGNRFDPTKRVWIDFTANRAGLRIRITDEGDGFDPRQVADPTLAENKDRDSGRGVCFIRNLMTGVRYNEAGNSLEMWKAKRCARN